jgi:hypothetical protein
VVALAQGWSPSTTARTGETVSSPNDDPAEDANDDQDENKDSDDKGENEDDEDADDEGDRGRLGRPIPTASAARALTELIAGTPGSLRGLKRKDGRDLLWY